MDLNPAPQLPLDSLDQATKKQRNVTFITLSQFGIAFSFNFIMVFMPFYIHKISPYSHAQTLIWIGLIMGASSIMAAMASTFWGTLTARFQPKTLYLRGLLSHTILIFLMGFVTSLPLLLLLRALQGVFGGISTIGLVMVSASSTPEAAAKNMGFFQNSLTLGQLLGPPLGALAASTLGYRGAFFSSAGLVFISLLFCFFWVESVQIKPRTKKRDDRRTLRTKTIFFAWALCFAGTAQLMFLPGILPNVFESMAIAPEIALKWSGLFVMAYTATAMVGTFCLCRIAPGFGAARLVLLVGVLGALLQGLFALCPNMGAFASVRMIQTGLIAALLPLIISMFASDLSGTVLGLLNASRFAGNAVGPLMATTILAAASLTWVYLAISALGLLSVAGFWLTRRK